MLSCVATFLGCMMVAIEAGHPRVASIEPPRFEAPISACRCLVSPLLPPDPEEPEEFARTDAEVETFEDEIETSSDGPSTSGLANPSLRWAFLIPSSHGGSVRSDSARPATRTSRPPMRC